MLHQKIMRVLIADDQPVFSLGLQAMVTQFPGLITIGVVRNGFAAIKACELDRPDLLIMDLNLPGVSGLNVLTRLEAEGLRPRTLVLTGEVGASALMAAKQLGVEGLARKTDATADINRAIEAVSARSNHITPSVRSLIAPLSTSHPNQSRLKPLTAREREVLTLVAAACTSDEIGRRLDISPKTAKKHRENIRKKLGISTVTEATQAAIRLGLVCAGH